MTKKTCYSRAFAPDRLSRSGGGGQDGCYGQGCGDCQDSGAGGQVGGSGQGGGDGQGGGGQGCGLSGQGDGKSVSQSVS